MTLLVGNIAASSTFDSASSVKDADKYFDKRMITAWDEIDDDTKEANLIKAADYIRAVYGSSWNAATLAATVVPYALGQANCELALIANTTDLKANKKRGKKSVKIGPLDVTYDDAEVSASAFTFASLLLTPLLVTAQPASVATFQRLFRA